VRIRRITKHSFEAIAEASIIALLVVGLMAGTAFAGKGGGKPSGGASATVQVVTDLNGNGTANHGDQVHFTLTTSNTYPVVSVTCTQGGSVVYGDSHPYYWPNIWEDTGVFSLASQAWSAGAADCNAVIKGTSSNGRVVTLGSTTFYVGA
jgi:hypothetical protein